MTTNEKPKTKPKTEKSVPPSLQAESLETIISSLGDKDTKVDLERARRFVDISGKDSDLA